MDSSSASSLHLAMAALVGASVMFISAFYIHKRSVNQILDRIILLRTGPSRSPRAFHADDDDEDDEDVESRPSERSLLGGSTVATDTDDDGGGGDEEARSGSYRISSSLPNALLQRRSMDAEEKLGGAPNRSSQAYSFGRPDSFPPGLPLLRTTQRERSNQSLNHSASGIRLTSFGRPSTPKSPGVSGFESVEVSDDEDIELANEDDANFSYDNDYGNSVLVDTDVDTNVQDSSIVLFGAADCISSQGQKYGAPSRSHGTENLHGNVAVDPASVHISRKNPKDILIPLETTPHEAPSREEEEVCAMIRECLALREKYVFRENVAPWMKETTTESSIPAVNRDPFCFDPVEPTVHYFQMEDGVVHVYASKDSTEDLFPTASSTTFFTDMHHILRIIALGNVRSTCHHRLRLLEEKFRLHLLVNADGEFLAQKSAPHRDFYNVRKVDTHVHHSACMNQKHLLSFIKSKLKEEPDEIVIFRDGIYLTLKDVFESLDLTGSDLNVDLLDVHADKNTFHRFDKFNLKYNPCGQSRLREIFLKHDNLIQGRFLGELTKQVLSDLEASKYQMAEYRVSIYGRKQSEWDQLASWFVNNRIYSENAVWLIQLPRLYNVYRGMGIVTSFQSMLDNVFIPLFEATIDPSSHPQLHVFLNQVVGFDMVDDESKPERRPTKHMPKPAEWTNEFNPAYSYYAYYCYANLYTLNKLRESKGMPTIKFRPHCGEAGDIDHLAAAFLVSHNIAHGNNLRKSPVLQYLYYLAQIGLAMSPLSNNSLFLDYHRNPFPMFFQRGLDVSLSTDDPLQIHLTKEPLVEEYSVAAQVWKLTACDLCEIARNSAHQSGFSHAAKLHWIGNKYFKRGPEGNDVHKTNIPQLRITFRHEAWKEEMRYTYSGKSLFPEEIDP
ncbi:AMP deaminase-like [Magnolia sinica]|uniref:AMP deaminase-like n=1 Tax=Magnolia sinica TaxID=86752 RepID=UPI0026595893|nr:AMP deaminase-like [Magnolia sinica]XP_058073871.1 AMP deaminase-like [Magnolia sinica]